MIPFLLPNIFQIAEQSSNEEYVKYVLPRLKIIFKLQKPVQVLLILDVLLVANIYSLVENIFQQKRFY
jgi:hypothetical protein